MSEADGKNEQAIATAARELFLLGRKTVAARAVLAAVHKELNQANTQLVDSGFNGAGLGIGLTVVRELIEAHGGTVTGTSAGEGQGSEFVVTLHLVIH